MRYVIAAVGIVAASLLAFWPDLIPVGDGASRPDDPLAAQRAIAVFVVAISLWVTNLIPLAATSLLVFALLPLLNVVDAEQAYAYFGNEAVFFIMGVFVLAAAMIDTGLSKRATLLFLHRFDRDPKRLVGGILAGSATLALAMPEHAVAAMMFPIVMELAEALGLKKDGNRTGRNLFLALAWGSVIGGVGTFLGGSRAPLALGILQDSYEGVTIGFLSWMAKSMPVVAILLIAAYYRLTCCNALDIVSVEGATRMLEQRVAVLGRLSSRERRLATLWVVTVLAWITLSGTIGLATISILSATMVFALRICAWQDLQPYINWGVIVMYGGAVAAASALHDTQATVLITSLIPFGSLPPVAIFLLMALAAMVLTEAISNVATVAVLLPLGLGICQADPNLDPVAMTYAITIASGLAFTFPMSSPPNAIAFSSGYYGMRQAIRAGYPLNLAAFAVLALVMLLWWPIVGLNIWGGGPP